MRDELVFEITEDATGGFSVDCVAEHVVRKRTSTAQLRQNLRDVVNALYIGHVQPGTVRLQVEREKVAVKKAA